MFSDTYRCKRLLHCAGVLFALLLLASCRLVIKVDESGHITSATSQYDCIDGECVFPIEGPVTETFTARPAEGYRFVRWQGLCKRSPADVCQITLMPLPEQLSQFSGDIVVSAIFEPTSVERPWYRDGDSDDYGSPTESMMAREQPPGFVINKKDCQDSDSKVHPGAREENDGRDNNCNGRVDEGYRASEFYQDADGDGYGNAETIVLETFQPAGYVSNNLDCDDTSSDTYPSAREMADGRDNDCDGAIDEGGTPYFRDVDGDGFGDRYQVIESLEPAPGYVTNGADCDDNNPEISPVAAEMFDSVDNDCDGWVDEGFTVVTYYRDADGDGFGDREDTLRDIVQPEGFVENGNDNCVSIHNADQGDIDRDGLGDACDPFTDTDGDGNQDSADNCPASYNPEQNDIDADGIGDACDTENGLDLDNDGINNETDNCPTAYNPGQDDSDHDGSGDSCDTVNDNPPVVAAGACQISAEDQQMLALVNEFRSQTRSCGSLGNFSPAPALSWDCSLKSAALSHSMDMASNDFFSHTGSTGSSAGDRASQAGYSWSFWGENIAAGTPLSSPSVALQGWIDSPGHCANLMEPNFTHLGAAKFSNVQSTYDVYWTQVFGRPR